MKDKTTIIVQTDNRKAERGSSIYYSKKSIEKLAKSSKADYYYFEHNAKGEDAYWQKFIVARDALAEGYENVLYVDTDVICVKKFNLEDPFLLMQKPIGICEDIMGLNTGVLFLKNKPATFEILTEAIETRDRDMERHPESGGLRDTYDQSVLKYVLLGHNMETYDFELMNAVLYNAQLETLYYETPEYFWYDYNEDVTNLVHLAGLPEEDKIKYCKKLL